MYIQDIYIGTVAVIPIVVGIIQLLKKLGMPSTWAPWVNFVLTLVGYAVSLLMLQYPHWGADDRQSAPSSYNVLDSRWILRSWR